MTIHGAPILTQNPQNGADEPTQGVFEYFEDDSGRLKSLLADLRAAGVVLSAAGDRLAFDAPAGALSDDLLARMRADRDGLLSILRGGDPAEPVAEPVAAGGDHDGVADSRPRVVHLKRDPFDVRIDRASKWGNPFRIGADGDRSEVIRKYRAWVIGQAELMAALGELRGKRLGCWCSPLPCHGDVLAELAAVADPVVATSIRCPSCESIDLGDDPDGLRCGSCGVLAWRATAEGGLVRADHAAGVAIDPAAVPACPSCGRWCDVLTLAEAWRCSGCDPEAPERRRRTLRVIGLVSRSRGLSVRGVRPGA